MRVDIWSDLVCPWCYLGKRRFETAVALFGNGHEVEIVHRSFQLDPSIPKGVSLRARDMLMRKYKMTEAQVIASQTRLEELAAVEGLEYHLAESHTGNTMDAHRLVHLGREQSIQDAVVDGCSARISPRTRPSSTLVHCWPLARRRDYGA